MDILKRARHEELMGLLLLKTNDNNLIYEFNTGTTLSIQVIKSDKRPKQIEIQPFKVVLVEQGSTITTHIYRSKENFRLNKKTRYDKVVARIVERPKQHYGH